VGRKSNYFRHSFNAHEDIKIMELIERGGIKCVGVYFVLLEIYGSMIMDDDNQSFKQNINTRRIANAVGLRSDSCRTCIELIADCKLIEAVRFKSPISYFEVGIPNFLKYFGRYSKTETIKCPNKRKEKEKKEKEMKEKEKPINIIPQRIFQLFISKFSGTLKIPKILGDDEIKNIGILSEKFIHNLEEWNLFFEKIKTTNLIENKSEADWKPSFDWLVTPKNAIKIINGNYDCNFNGNKNNKFISDEEENAQFMRIIKNANQDNL